MVEMDKLEILNNGEEYFFFGIYFEEVSFGIWKFLEVG